MNTHEYVHIYTHMHTGDMQCSDLGSEIWKWNGVGPHHNHASNNTSNLIQLNLI